MESSSAGSPTSPPRAAARSCSRTRSPGSARARPCSPRAAMPPRRGSASMRATRSVPATGSRWPRAARCRQRAASRSSTVCPPEHAACNAGERPAATVRVGDGAHVETTGESDIAMGSRTSANLHSQSAVDVHGLVGVAPRAAAPRCTTAITASRSATPICVRNATSAWRPAPRATAPRTRSARARAPTSSTTPRSRLTATRWPTPSSPAAAR